MEPNTIETQISIYMNFQFHYLLLLLVAVLAIVAIVFFMIGSIRERQKQGFIIITDIANDLKKLTELVHSLATNAEVNQQKNSEKLNILSREVDRVEGKINHLNSQK